MLFSWNPEHPLARSMASKMIQRNRQTVRHLALPEGTRAPSFVTLVLANRSHNVCKHLQQLSHTPDSIEQIGHHVSTAPVYLLGGSSIITAPLSLPQSVCPIY